MSSGYQPYSDGLLRCGICVPRQCYRKADYVRVSDGQLVGLCRKHIEENGFVCANCGMVDTDHLVQAGNKCLFLPTFFVPTKKTPDRG